MTESKRWDEYRSDRRLPDIAAEIVEWVIANGGEAVYESHLTHDGFIYRERAPGGHTSDRVRPARIVITGPDRPLSVGAGDEVVMGERWFDVVVDPADGTSYRVREFTVTKAQGR